MQQTIKIKTRGRALLEDPYLNKGTAFSIEERRAFGIEGRLPQRVETLDEQIARSYEQFSKFNSPLNKYIFLRGLQDYSRTEFYALIQAHIEEMLPIVYTPTVGQAIEEFSQIYRAPRGLVVTEDNYKNLDSILAGFSDTDLAVVTDAEGILGIGDQGFGGIAICMGKLSLYSLTAGINPARSLPVILDFGTDNKKLLEDPFYLGVRQPRTRGDKYFAMVDAFIAAWSKRFPNALLQWEDLSKSTAFDALARYREQVPSFNDDIQGTGAMALAGLLAATEQGKTLTQQVFLVSGAGAGGIGVAMQVRNGLMRLGMSAADAHKRIYVLDSRGLILDDRDGLEDYKKEFTHKRSDLAEWELASKNPNLLETIYNAKVTVLLGLSGQGSQFDQKIIEAVLKNTAKPIVFALSNPTNLTEILPEDAIAWTDGQVWMATGSPFAPVSWKGKQHLIGQGNNTFVFPGIGWGVAASGARTVEAEMMTDASFALAAQVTPERLASGAVFPPIADLMQVTDHVARAVAESAFRIGVATVSREQMEQRLAKRDWTPAYATYELDAG